MRTYRIVREPNAFKRDFDYHIESRSGWWWPFWSRYNVHFGREEDAIRQVEDALWCDDNPPTIIKEW